VEVVIFVDIRVSHFDKKVKRKERGERTGIGGLGDFGLRMGRRWKRINGWRRKWKEKRGTQREGVKRSGTW
jgi:hypothetical protein